jgi:hypothetical protein
MGKGNYQEDDHKEDQGDVKIVAPITFWLKSLKGRDNAEDLDVDGRIILEWIVGK